MIINIFGDVAYIQKKHKLTITKLSELKFNDDDIVIVNNSDYIDRIKNTIDLRIFHWIVNNIEKKVYYDVNMVDKYFNEQEEFVKENRKFVNAGFKYTEYHKKINKLFKLSMDKKKVNALYEEYRLNKNIAEKNPNYKMDDTYEYIFDDNRCFYSFLNSNGRVISDGFNTRKIKKEHYNLFFVKDNTYYFDIKNFYPTVLGYIIGNEKYMDITFYDKYSEVFKISRKEFKEKFNAFMNGAGKKSIGDIYDDIITEFNDVNNLRYKFKNDFIINYFGRKFYVDEEYKKLGYYISTSAENILYEIYDALYDEYYNNENIIFNFNIYDGFLVNTNKDFDIDSVLKTINKKYDFLRIQVDKLN